MIFKCGIYYSICPERTYVENRKKKEKKKCFWAKRAPFLSPEGLPWWGYDFGIWFTHVSGFGVGAGVVPLFVSFEREMVTSTEIAKRLAEMLVI